MSDPVLSYLQHHRAKIIDRLFELVRAQSVSTDPAYEQGMAQARELLSHRMSEMGLCNLRELERGGHPALYADWLGAGDKPTLMVYGHYDVQPPDPIEQWHSPPFEPEVRDGKIYGRGISDDKGPTIVALETIAAFLCIEGALPFNVRLLLEGEEELSSPTLAAVLRNHAPLLAVDAVISADGARWRSDLVTVNIGSRGNSGFEFTVRTAVKDLHSGRYGGIVPNALHVMAELVGALHAPDGSVAVPGFYDGVREVTDAERDALRDIPFDETSL
ncbi:MAG: M20/M25/M40 family metallo-hydrolase, partial [Gemmatimonadota bacterium]